MAAERLVRGQACTCIEGVAFRYRHLLLEMRTGKAIKTLTPGPFAGASLRRLPACLVVVRQWSGACLPLGEGPARVAV